MCPTINPGDQVRDYVPIEAYGGWPSGYHAYRNGTYFDVPGPVADRVGRLVLNRLANRYGYPIRITSDGDYHPAGTIYEVGGKGYA